MGDRRALISKIRSERGESLTEIIVAFLVIAFVLLAFAGMLTVGFNLTTQAESLDRASTNMTGNVSIAYTDPAYNTTYDKGSSSAGGGA